MKRKTFATGIDLLLFTLLCLACSVFDCLFIRSLVGVPIQKFQTPLLWVSEILLFLLYLFSALCAVKKWEGRIKLLYFVYFFLLFLLVGGYLYFKLDFFRRITSVEDLRKIISRAGSLAWIAFILLQFLQVTLLPIPGVASTTVGLLLFGPHLAFLYSLIGIYFGSLVAFWVGKKLGYKAVAWFVGEENLQKWLQKMKGKDELFLSLALFLPLFPDDILCFVAGLSSMKFPRFALICFLARVVSIASTCYLVNYIPLNTWWGILIWAILFTLLLLFFFLIYKKFDKLQEKFRARKQNKHKSNL